MKRNLISSESERSLGQAEISNRTQDPTFGEYLDAFVRDFEGPYAIQWPGRGWSTRYRKVSDPLIRAHLDKKYWLALKAPWYPRFSYIDVDAPGEGTLERIKEVLGLERGGYLLCTSPSFWQTGNMHLIFKPRYNGQPATKKLIRTIVKPPLEALRVELFPQERRKFRLPFGRDQHIIDEWLDVPLPHSWREALHWVEKIEEFDMERVPHQLQLPLSFPRVESWSRKTKAEELLAHGLQAPGTRHKGCFLLAKYFYRLNRDPSEARHAIKRWIREKNNGFSREVNQGRWDIVDGEIDRQVGWVYDHYERRKCYPDSTHNLEGWITAEDLRLIAELFRGDVINQKRLFRLICYYRPRSHHRWVFIPRWRWVEFASEQTYKQFQNNLERRGFMETIESYKVGEFCKRFRLTLPSASKQDKIEEDGRAVQDFYGALCLVVGDNPRDLSAFTGADRRNFFPDRRL